MSDMEDDNTGRAELIAGVVEKNNMVTELSISERGHFNPTQ